jgi:hypothetical protein
VRPVPRAPRAPRAPCAPPEGTPRRAAHFSPLVEPSSTDTWLLPPFCEPAGSALAFLAGGFLAVDSGKSSALGRARASC